MDKFFNPKSIAIVGASVNKKKIGAIILNNLISLGFSGKIYPVNPKYDKILDLNCYSSLDHIKGGIDLAVIAVPSEAAVGVIRQSVRFKNKIRRFIVISAGFKEIGDKGLVLEQQLIDLAAKNNLKIIGPNCLGVINPLKKINASFAKNNFKAGQIGLIMQSGALTTALFDLAESENIGFSKVVTIGNKAVLDETDFLDYLAKDKYTAVIGMYLEDIKIGDAFRKVLSRVCGLKPVVVIKAGNSDKAKKAIQSHTGVMAGESAVAREAVESSGGIYVESFNDFVNIIKILTNYKRVRTNQVVVLTNAGGVGVIATDLVEQDKFLNIRQFGDREKLKLKKAVKIAGSVQNPVDLLGDAKAEDYSKVLKIVRDFNNVGAVVAIATMQAQTNITAISKVIRSANSFCTFPVVPVIVGSRAHYEAQLEFKKDGLNNFIFPDQAINALSSLSRLSVNKRQLYKGFEYLETLDNIDKLVVRVRSEHRKCFYFEESRVLAESYNLNIVKSSYVKFSDKLRFPLVVKIDSDEVLHKFSQGGVITNIDDRKQLDQAVKKIRTKFRQGHILVQEQVQPGLELILGIKYDGIFGHVIMLGLGGIMAELISQRLLWLLPVSRADLKYKIENHRIGAVIEKQGIDIEQVVSQLEIVVNMALENKWIAEMDINPMIFYKDKKSVVVDVKVLIRV